MNGKETIAIFDIGKTNKKLLLFDDQYNIVYEENERLPETVDEDGFPCEDIKALTNWVRERFDVLLADGRFNIKAVNFSGYGASLVYLNEEGEVIPPLYNYLKPYPASLNEKFYNDYGGQTLLCRQTASPALGSLNSGLQLYRIKQEQAEKYATIKFALHLPQYLSFILSGACHSELTSIGCHTCLWDFNQKKYHDWVVRESLDTKFPANRDSFSLAGYHGAIAIGVGLHDSSAALIPYLNYFSEPFLLLSTGTWSISLNPFNDLPLTDAELEQDCLCFLSYKGTQVKASRLFAGYRHEQQVKKISEYFQKPPSYYEGMEFEKDILLDRGDVEHSGDFENLDLAIFENDHQAYHWLMKDIVHQQAKKTKLVLGDVRRIFVDGGFSRNRVFMHLFSEAFSNHEVYAASVAQASALGAALVMHEYWNQKEKPGLVHERYSGSK